MPQDIPVEASEELVFIPPSLAEIDPAPRFVLRAATKREERFISRLRDEEGLRFHPKEALRAEILRGLRDLWTAEQVDEHVPVLQAYWEAADDFALQVNDEPGLVFDYDPDLIRACDDLSQRVAEAHRPLRRMLADNRDFETMLFPVICAVIIKSWSGFKAKRALDRGYLTTDAVFDVQKELATVEKAAGLTEGTAWLELAVACSKRMSLEKEEEKNSESPSPSGMNQAASSETPASEPAGKSPASAASKKTRATA